jgi:hypothetical protein
MTIQNLISSIPATFERIDNISFKTKLVAMLAAFLAPLYNFIFVLILLLIIDMFTSIYSQIKTRTKRCTAKDIGQQEKDKYIIKTAWRTVDPQKMLQTVEKIFGYAISLIVCFVLDHYILRLGVDASGFFHPVSITNVVYITILVSEGISILRNLGNITNNSVFNQIIRVIVKRTKLDENDENN